MSLAKVYDSLLQSLKENEDRSYSDAEVLRLYYCITDKIMGKCSALEKGTALSEELVITNKFLLCLVDACMPAILSDLLTVAKIHDASQIDKIHRTHLYNAAARYTYLLYSFFDLLTDDEIIEYLDCLIHNGMHALGVYENEKPCEPILSPSSYADVLKETAQTLKWFLDEGYQPAIICKYFFYLNHSLRYWLSEPEREACNEACTCGGGESYEP